MQQGFYYLAIPYTGTEEEQATRAELSFIAARECLRQGIHLFAPLMYINNLADSLSLTPEQRRKILMAYLFDFLKTAAGMMLLTAEGWKTSWGVQQELVFAYTHKIPVYKIDPHQLYEDLPSLLKTALNEKDLRAIACL